MTRTQWLTGQLPLFTPDSDWQPPTELPDLRVFKEVALDTETRDLSLAAGRGSGWPYGNATLCGVSVAWAQGALYAPIAHPDTPGCFHRAQVANWLRDHDRAGVRFIFHCAPYDLGTLLSDAGVQPFKNIDDTTAMAVMVNENRNDYTLEGVAQWLGLEGKDESLLSDAAASYGFKDIKSNLWRLPGKYVGPYAEADALATYKVAQRLRPIMIEEETIDAYQLEMDLIPLVLEMRRRGIRIDTDKAEQNRNLLIKRRDQLLINLSDRLGVTVGIGEINSARHIEQYFDALKIPYNRTLKSKQGKFDNEFLENHDHWLPKIITNIRQLEVAQSKFLKGFLLEYAHKGRIHASINQFKSETGGTKTHRLSYSDPPLQQMYGRESTDLKRELVPFIRGCFLPEEGEIWGAPDYSQQEYRLIVHFCERLNLRKAKEAGDRYRNDPSTDFHDYVKEITGLDRSRAKDCNFATVYGAGIDKFAFMTKLSLEEAKETRIKYDEELPFPKLAGAECKTVADRRGYIRMIDGARSHFNLYEPAYRNRKDEEEYKGDLGVAPCSQEQALKRVGNPNHPWKGRIVRAYTHKAFNHLIQGSAARQMKKAMKLCWSDGLVPLIQMHDELGFSFSSEKEGMRVVELMKNAIQLTVPMKVDAEYGVSWGTARVIKNKNKEVLYGATWNDALRLQKEGQWW